MKSSVNLDGPRCANVTDLERILDLANEVMRRAKGMDPTIANDYSFIYNRENVENIVIVKDGDRVVSSAAIWANSVEEARSRKIRTGGINCVATLPGYRGYGLATKVLQAAVKHMEEIGCHIGRLRTGIPNWYHRLGWENAGFSCTYRLVHSNIVLFPELPGDLNLKFGSGFDDETIASIVRLRQFDQLGGVRTQEIMRELLASGRHSYLKGGRQYFLALRKRSPVAYCITRGDKIIEWGGSVELVSGLVRACFYHKFGAREGQLTPGHQERVSSSPELMLVAPKNGHPFADFLDSTLLPVSRDYWGMLYIINPRSILDACGLNDISVTENNGIFTLTRSNESVTVNRQEIAKLFFGPERISDFASEVLPLTFWEWPLEDV